MTKIVTAAAAMQEVERGGLGLDQDMRPLVPQLAQMEILRGFEADGRPILEPNANPITLRHLLTHTAGLGYDAADPDLARWSKAVGRTASAYDFSLDGFTTPLKFPSGEGWWYGAGLDWAAEALAAAASARKGGAKTRLADLVQEGILDPLGMQSTTFYSLKAGESLQRRKVATSYRDPETGTLSIGPLPVPSEPPVQSGGGGLWTTCEDFSKFLRAVLVCSLPEAAAAAADAAAGYGGADAAGRRRRRILRPETVAEMLQPQLDDRQREALRSVTAEYHDSMVPEFERTTPLDYGISGIINLADVPSKRKAGSMMWKGFTNGQWASSASFLQLIKSSDKRGLIC